MSPDERTDWRLDQLERSQRTLEEGTRRQAEWGAKQNEQIRALCEDVEKLQATLSKVLWALVLASLSFAGAAITFALGVLGQVGS